MTWINDEIRARSWETGPLIYGIRDPRSLSEIRYVGQTINFLCRVKAHLSPSIRRKCRTYCALWLKSLLDEQVFPDFIVLEKFVDRKDLDGAERKYIADYKARGYRLANGTNGGIAGYAHIPEVREKISLSSKGIPKTQEHREAIRQSRIGMKLTAEHRRAIGLGNIGKSRPKSEGSKERLSVKQSQKWSDADYKFVQSAHIKRGWSNSKSRTLQSGHQKRRFSNFRNRIEASKWKGGRPFKDQFGNIYYTHSEAAVKLDLHASLIGHVLIGKRKSTGRYRFSYIED
jgi:hypothetical protein